MKSKPLIIKSFHAWRYAMPITYNGFHGSIVGIHCVYCVITQEE